MKYANQIGYSDIHPYEVIEQRTERKLIIRAMETLELEWEKEVYAGGFSAHFENQSEQKWDIKPDQEGHVVSIRQHKDGHWYDTSGARYRLSDKPRKFYDYNF